MKKKNVTNTCTQDWKTRWAPAINEYVETIKTKAIMKAVKTENELYLGMLISVSLISTYVTGDDECDEKKHYF